MSLRIPLSFPHSASTSYPTRPDDKCYFVTPPENADRALYVPGENVQESQGVLQWLVDNPGRQIRKDVIPLQSSFRELSFVRDKYLQDVQAIAEEWKASGSPMSGPDAERLAHKLSDARVVAREGARSRSRIPTIVWEAVDGGRELARTGSLVEVRSTLQTGKDSVVRSRLANGEFALVAKKAGVANGRLGPTAVSVAKRIQPWLNGTTVVLIAVDLGYNGYRIFTAQSDEEQLKALAHFAVSAATAAAGALCVATPLAGFAGVAACVALPIAAGLILDYKIDNSNLQQTLP